VEAKVMTARRRGSRLLRSGIGLVALLAAAAGAADEVVVLTTDSFAGPFVDAEAWFERSTKHELVGVVGGLVDGAADSIPARLARGEPADVVIMAAQTLDALIAAGEVEPGTRRDLVRELAVHASNAAPEAQRATTFAAGIAVGARAPAAARELIEFLASPALGPIVEKHGLEHVGHDARAWQPLFNGQDLAGWTAKIRGHASGVNYADTFRVVDGALTVAYDGYDSFDEQFGHLFYARAFSHYRLRIEYRFVGVQAPNAPAWAARNSGVMVHSQPPETMLRDQDFPISIEVQFLGGLNDGRPRPTGNLCSPGTRVVYQGQPDASHCIQAAAPTIDGDRWVTADVLVQGSERIVHYIDGLPVIEYRGISYGGGNVNGHDAAAKPDGAPLARGYIALQSESHPIQFRRVELLELTE
jgi:hypothetical protein